MRMAWLRGPPPPPPASPVPLPGGRRRGLARRQPQNLEDCFDKLQGVVDAAVVVPALRVMREGSSEEGKAVRVVSKRLRSEVKSARRRPEVRDD